jgi:hypothetical protein
MAARRVEALERQVARLQQEVDHTNKLADEYAIVVDELEKENSKLQETLAKQDFHIKKIEKSFQQCEEKLQQQVNSHKQQVDLSRERDLILVAVDQKRESLLVENEKLKAMLISQRMAHEQKVKSLQQDVSLAVRHLPQQATRKSPIRSAPTAPTVPTAPTEPPTTQSLTATEPPISHNESTSTPGLFAPPPPPLSDYSGTEEDNDEDEDEDGEGDEISELPSSITATTATTTSSTRKSSTSQNKTTTEIKKENRKHRKKRLESSHNSSNSIRRGSYFGASSLKSSLQKSAVKEKTNKTNQKKEKKTWGNRSPPKKNDRRRSHFGIYQAPRYHRESVVLNQFFGGQHKKTSKEQSAPPIHSKNDSRGKVKRRESVSFLGLQHARDAERKNPLSLAKSYLSIAGITKSWDDLFQQYSIDNTTSSDGHHVLELPQFKTMVRDGCKIGKESIPDFLIRRIFDLVDKDRLGEIVSLDFQIWLKNEDGALKKIISPNKMYGLSDLEEGEEEEEEFKEEGGQDRRLSVQEREQLRLESIRLRLSLVIESRVDDGTVRGWKAVFRAHDHMNTGKLELHTFTSTFRNKFKLSSDPEFGGCTDRELRDVFFKVDTFHTGHVPIDPILDWLFKGREAPKVNSTKSLVREGGRAAAALNKAISPLAFGRSTSDQRQFFSPEGVEVKGHHAMPKKMAKDLLGPTKKAVSRLFVNQEKKETKMRERERMKLEREMKECTFQPNINSSPSSKTTNMNSKRRTTGPNKKKQIIPKWFKDRQNQKKTEQEKQQEEEVVSYNEEGDDTLNIRTTTASNINENPSISSERRDTVKILFGGSM